MKFFSKRRNAFIIAAIVVVLVTVFGVKRSATAQAREVIGEFSSGSSSIQSQLDSRASSSMRMYSIYNSSYRDVSRDLDTAAETLRGKRSDLTELMDGHAGASALFQANEALQSAGEDYYAILSNLESIADEDMNNLNSDYSSFNNAQRVIGTSSYNSSVQEFHRTVLSSFPLTLFRTTGISWLSIETPELFA